MRSFADDTDSEVHTSDLAPEVHNDLMQQLKYNYSSIRSRYSSYIRCIRSSLQEDGITVKDLSSYLLTLPAFDDEENVRLMSQSEEKLKGAADITDIIDFISKQYASFLEYDIFQDIIEEYKLDQSLERLQYPKHLKDYIQMHTLSEFMELNPTLEKYSSAKELILKFDIKLPQCKLATLLDLKNAIAAILKVKPSALRLLTLKEGCLMVKFLIPEFIANIIFAEGRRFTSNQVQDFLHHSLLWLKCGNFEFPFKFLSDKSPQG